jgi:hypothetical protein
VSAGRLLVGVLALLATLIALLVLLAALVLIVLVHAKPPLAASSLTGCNSIAGERATFL